MDNEDWSVIALLRCLTILTPSIVSQDSKHNSLKNLFMVFFFLFLYTNKSLCLGNFGQIREE